MIPHFSVSSSEADIEAVVRALRAGHLAQGEEVARLEQTLSRTYDGAEVVAVSSGTAALYLSLRALDLPSSGRVVIPSYTCNSLYAAVCHASLEPICADLPAGGVSLGREGVASACGEQAVAVIAPHTCGYEADIEGIGSLGLPVIEDCAQAFGGRDAGGRPLGSLSRLAVVSFYATKLPGGGEGGAVITREAGLAETVRHLRNCDERAPHPHAFNFKMTDLCAALVSSRLEHFEAELARRRELAALYDEHLGDRAQQRLTAQRQAVPFRYLVDAGADADAVITRAQAGGVRCRRPVYAPIHRHTGDICPETEKQFQRLLSVPIYAVLPPEDAATVGPLLAEILAQSD